MPPQTHDFSGLRCPMPIVHLDRIMKAMPSGGECTVISDDLAFYHDVAAWCRRTGNELLDCQQQDNRTVARLRKAVAAASAAESRT